jgi:uncharacterized membrane protein YuzA (DUF378 family)
MRIIDRFALTLSIIAGLNWGLVALFGFDLVAYLFNGSTATMARVVYVLLALGSLWCISLLLRHRDYDVE